MCIKLMYNIITFNNVIQYQMENFNSAKMAVTFVKPSKWMGFPCSSAGKEASCNAGDLGSKMQIWAQ